MITTEASILKINKLTKAQYEAALSAGKINEDELYMTEDSDTDIEQMKTHIIDTDIHVTTEEKTNWNAKASTDIATQTVDGLMSSIDKTKLDGIEEGATNYTHPETHAATMITEDETHRFVTDEEKSTWNSNTSIDVDTELSSTSENPVQNKVIKDALDAKSNKPTTTSVILTAANWSTADNTYSFETDYPSDSYNISVDIDGDNCTESQLKAWYDAKPLGSSTNKINAKGTIPTMDIPVILTVTPK